MAETVYSFMFGHIHIWDREKDITGVIKAYELLLGWNYYRNNSEPNGVKYNAPKCVFVFKA